MESLKGSRLEHFVAKHLVKRVVILIAGPVCRKPFSTRVTDANYLVARAVGQYQSPPFTLHQYHSHNLPVYPGALQGGEKMRIQIVVSFVFLLSLLALHPSSSAQEIYKWRDDKGVRHYSDKPPKNLPLEEQQIKIKHRKWEDECPHKKDWGRVIKYYCHCVGRTVMDRHTKVEIGKIVGVAWQPKGVANLRLQHSQPGLQGHALSAPKFQRQDLDPDLF